MKPPKLTLKNGNFYIRRRVPLRYAAVEARTILDICLFTDSRTIAEQKAGSIWSEMIESWEALLRGDDLTAEARLAAARDLAHRRGFQYLDSREVVRLPLQDLIARVRAVRTPKGGIDMKVADATLGLPKKSKIKVSEAVDEFYSVASDRLVGKSESQIKRHRNPRKAATQRFIEAVSDKALADLSAEDMFKFKRHLIGRVERGEVTAPTANKDLIHLVSTWKQVALSRGFKLGFSTEGLMLKASKRSKQRVRPPFSPSWIKDKLLAPGALDGLNTEARLIILGMINTGYRPSEGAGLLPDEIVLAANIPHIIIQPNANRTLKNEQSERIIPLTGISLEAFRQARNGFPRYARDNDNLSAVTNKFLTTNGLLETPKHTVYSLRHSMEDRMLRAGIDERIRMDILGHQISRERYGEGGGLKHVYDLLKPIAL